MRLLLNVLAAAVLVSANDSEMHNDASLVHQTVPLVVFNESYVYKEQQNILLSKKVTVAGQLYTVTDAITKHPVFGKITADFLSIRNIRTLYDINDNPICNIRNNFTLLAKQGLYLGDKHEILVAKFEEKLSLFRLRIVATTTNLNSGMPIEVLLLGDVINILNYSCRIYLVQGSNRTLIAKITTKGTFKELLGKRDYIIRVAAGVDTSFIVMMVASFDSHIDKDEDSSSKSNSNSRNK